MLSVATPSCVALLAVPRFTRRRDAGADASSVDEQLCVGCNQCALDCPYGAIAMVRREGRGSNLVARVDPSLCVSCGICAGSCPPMGVGPPGRTGRDQMTRVRDFIAEPARRAGEIVVICCEHSAASSFMPLLSQTLAAETVPPHLALAQRISVGPREVVLVTYSPEGRTLMVVNRPSPR